jgi:hypothetical protein
MGKDNPHYVLVPRKTVMAILTIFICLLIGIIASFQYASYVDRKSNQRWCGVVGLFIDSYKEIPPPTELGKKIEREMLLIEGDFRCPRSHSIGRQIQRE